MTVWICTQSCIDIDRVCSSRIAQIFLGRLNLQLTVRLNRQAGLPDRSIALCLAASEKVPHEQREMRAAENYGFGVFFQKFVAVFLERSIHFF